MEFEQDTFSAVDCPDAVPVERPDRRSPENRRRHPRYQITTTAEFTEQETGARGSARTSDVSLGGCFVDTTSPYPAGKRIQLRLSRGGQSIECPAEVVCSLPGMGMGLRFLQCDAPMGDVLADWIGELTGERPAAPVHHEAETPFQRALGREPVYVLNELILMLMRKGVIPESSGDAMLRRLHQF
jgi:hypothetical protein